MVSVWPLSNHTIENRKTPTFMLPKKPKVSGTGEMVQWLRALAVLQDDLSRVPGTQAVAKN